MLKEHCDMKMIQRYIDSMCDELNGAAEYAEYYIIYKSSMPQWSKMYQKMANDELDHAEYIREMAQTFADGLSWISDHDKDCWKNAIDHYAEMVAKTKVMLEK